MRRFFASILALITTLPGPIRAADDKTSQLSKISVVTAEDEVVVRLVGTKSPDFTTYTQRDPFRVVVDWSGSRFVGQPEEQSVGPGLIRRIRTKQIESESEHISRVTIELALETAFRFETEGRAVLVRFKKVEVPPPEPVLSEAPASATPSPSPSVAQVPDGPLTEPTELPKPPPKPPVAPAPTAAPSPSPPKTAVAATSPPATAGTQKLGAFVPEGRAKESPRPLASLSPKPNASPAVAASPAPAAPGPSAPMAAKVVSPSPVAPSPTPSASPSPLASLSPRPSASPAAPTPTPTSSPSPSPLASLSPRPSPSQPASPSPLASLSPPSPRPSASPASPSPSPLASLSPSPRPSVSPASPSPSASPLASLKPSPSPSEQRSAPVAGAPRPGPGSPTAAPTGKITLAEHKPSSAAAPVAESAEYDRGARKMTYVGFRQKSETSEVFVRVDGRARYKVEQPAPDRVVVELFDTRVNVKNNERALDTSYFNSAVTRVQAVPSAHSTRIEIDLRDNVPYEVKRIGTTISLEFKLPEG